MARIILDLGFLKVSASYLQRRSSGLFYYYRRIPQDLRSHYGNKRFRIESLKTTDEHTALKKVAKLSTDDTLLWESLRSPTSQRLQLTTDDNTIAARALLRELGLAEGQAYSEGPNRSVASAEALGQFIEYLEAQHGAPFREERYAEGLGDPTADSGRFLSVVERETSRLLTSNPNKPRVLLSDARKHYLENRPKTPTPKFIRDSTAYIAKVTEAVGDLPLTEYRREHANKVRDKLIASGIATGTVRRTLNSISAIFNHGRREFDLTSIGNPFEGVQIAAEGEDAEAKDTFTPEELQAVAAACKLKDDDIRHLVALFVDTGARNGEIVGLRIEDVFLDHATPHIYIRPYEHLGRTLKNANSERKVPLVGVALWAAKRATASHGESKSGWLFPRYAADHNIKATYASNTMNKWLRKGLKIDKTVHSFRHTIRDLLRAVEAPEEIQDAIGGWSSQGSVGRTYGQGYVLPQLKDWLEKAVLRQEEAKGS